MHSMATSEHEGVVRGAVLGQVLALLALPCL